MIGRVIGKLDAGAPLFCHDPHINWRYNFRKTVPVYRQPVPFGEVEEHRRIAARGNDSPGRAVGLSRRSSRYSCPLTNCTRSFR